MVVRAVGDDALGTWLDVHNACLPTAAVGPGEARWARAQTGAFLDLLAERDGVVIGCAGARRSAFAAAPVAFGPICVLPAARRAGTGGALLAAIADWCRDAGIEAFAGAVDEDDAGSLAAVGRLGFARTWRDEQVALAVPSPSANAPDPGDAQSPLPPGVELVTYADHPDLLDGIYAVACETFADIPDAPPDPGTLANFRRWSLEPYGADASGTIVAVAAGAVVGYASVQRLEGRPGVARHEMTGVARAWRGQGIAIALKRRQIAWAAAAGLTTLEAGNDEANAGMRRINAILGYRPLPARIGVRRRLGA